MIAVRPDAGYKMIRNIAIQNFRCFESLVIKNCARTNIIVGDNGSGKTALLEAIFLALGSSPQLALRMRQWRGLAGSVAGLNRAVEQSLWGGFFHKADMMKVVSVGLEGDGPEARRLRIFRSTGDTLVPLDEDSDKFPARGCTFEWIDASGQPHSYTPRLREGQVSMPEPEEDLPDFFMIPASQNVGALDTAARFSELSKVGAHLDFVRVFCKEYPWIEDISLEVHGGTPVLHAKVEGMLQKIPMSEVSAGINRMCGVLLAIASRPKAVVIVDEIENGIYYEHTPSFIRSLLDFASKYQCQLFLTTHSVEWLKAYAEVAGDHMDDTSLFRVQRHGVQQLAGPDLANGLEFGEEIR